MHFACRAYWIAMMLATTFGRVALSLAADPALRDLIINSATNNDVTGLQRALDRGFPVDEPLDGSGATALGLATNPAIVRALLASKASVNITNNSGYSPLAHAAELGNLEMIDLLLNSEANVSLSGPTVCGALCASVIGGNIAITRRLLDAGARPGLADCWNRQALTFAARSGRLDMAELLLEHEADTNQYETTQGDTILIVGATASAEVVRALASHGAKVDWPNPLTCETALHRAAERGRGDVVSVLLGLGLNPRLADKQGTTALGTAERRHQNDAAAILRATGAPAHAPPTRTCVSTTERPDAAAAWTAAYRLACQ